MECEIIYWIQTIHICLNIAGHRSGRIIRPNRILLQIIGEDYYYIDDDDCRRRMMNGMLPFALEYLNVACTHQSNEMSIRLRLK